MPRLRDLAAVGADYATTGPNHNTIRQPILASADAPFRCLEDGPASKEWQGIDVEWTSEPPFGIGTTRTARGVGQTTEEDRATHARLGLRDRLQPDRLEAFRQGGRASYHDVTIPGRWPIPLEQISMPVHLWQGDDDRAVGGMGRYLAQHLPNCRATFIPAAGHFWLFEHMPEILDALVPQTKTAPASQPVGESS